MTYKLDYNFLKLEYKDLYNTIKKIEGEKDLEVIRKSILKLLKYIIEIIYIDNKIVLNDKFSNEEVLTFKIIDDLESEKLVASEIIEIFKSISKIKKADEINENILEETISREDFVKIYELVVWFVINYGEEDYSLFFNKLNLKEKQIFSKYLNRYKFDTKEYRAIINENNDKDIESAKEDIETEEIEEKEEEIYEDEEEDEVEEEDEDENTEEDYIENDKGVEFVEKGEIYYFGRGVEKNIYKARRYFQKAANLGNEYGEVYLGLFYEKGLGGELDFSKAMYWYEKSAIKENAFAQYSIGYLYFNGKGVEQSYLNSFKWYKKSAENGFPAAQHALAYLYKMGEGCEESIYKAYYWLELAAENDFEDSFYVLGESYFQGEYVELNYKKAYKYLSKAAEIGNEKAIETLADMYYFGFYVDEDKNKAFKLYNKSIKLGNTDLYYKLGKIYEDEGKYKAAINSYKKGHENNDIRSTQKLGVIYYNGEITEKNIEKSLEYMEIASKEKAPHALYVMGIAHLNSDKDKAITYLKEAYKLGSMHAAEVLASELLIDFLNDKKIDEEELLGYIKKAMIEDLEDSIYYYGLINAYGIGVKKNYEEAFKYFKIAAEKDCEKAIIKIANWYKDGVYVKANPVEAIKWYKKAAEKFNSDAITSIIEIYEKGIGIEPDYERAFEGVKLLREACIVKGNLKMAYYYIEGIGTKVNIEKAEKIIEETMELDEGETLKFLGELAESGIYKKGKTRELTYYLQAIENGCIEAKKNVEYYAYKKNIKNEIYDNEIYSSPFLCGKSFYLNAIRIFKSGQEKKDILQIENGIKELKKSVKMGFYPAIFEIIKYYENEPPTRENLINLSKYKQKAIYYNIKLN